MDIRHGDLLKYLKNTVKQPVQPQAWKTYNNPTQAVKPEEIVCIHETVSYMYDCEVTVEIRVYPMDHLQFVGA